MTAWMRCTTTDLTRVTELNDGMIKTYDVDPLNYFGEYADPKGSIWAETQSIMPPSPGPFCLAARVPNKTLSYSMQAQALWPQMPPPPLKKRIEMAIRSIETGAAMEKLELLADYTRENA